MHSRRLVVSLALALTTLCGVLPVHADDALAAALANPKRSEKFVKRDAVRHPGPELAFFGLAPSMTVVEISPGGGYWTEILAPYLQPAGKLYVAIPPTGDPEAPEPGKKNPFLEKLAADPATYGKLTVTELGAGHFTVAPPGSADLVLTFRNLHNWMNAGYAEQALAGFYQALKPGGVFGIEEHRGRSDRPQDPKAESGYVRQDYAIELARKAGFELLASSEINANPRDTADWPDGVWTLPPTLTLGDKDRSKYLAIGEADNFVLKFRKPLK